MAGVVNTPTGGPPPLAGYIESPPGSGHWIPDPSLGGSTPPAGGGGSTPAPGGSIPSLGGGTIATRPPVAIPVANFSHVVYASGIVAFINTSLGSITAYLWSFGDGEFSHQSTVLHQYGASGTFPVTLTVINSAGQSSKTVNVVVPAAAIVETVDFTFAVGALGVQFTDASTKAGLRQWDFGDGTTSTDDSPYKLYDTPGIYTVTLSIGGTLKTYQIPVDSGIVLTWEDNSNDEDGFKVERSPNGSTGWTLIATTVANVEMLTVTKNLHGVDPGVTNFFRVYSFNGIGDSDYSNVVETLCGG